MLIHLHARRAREGGWLDRSPRLKAWHGKLFRLRGFLGSVAVIGGDLEGHLEAKRFLLDAVEWVEVADPQRVKGRVGGKLADGRLSRQQSL